MPTLMIGYDLNRPGQDYATLIERIQSLGSWWHHLDSTWLVQTSLSAAQARDRLQPLLDSSDELLIIDVTGRAWATTGLSKRANDWLRNHL